MKNRKLFLGLSIAGVLSVAALMGVRAVANAGFSTAGGDETYHHYLGVENTISTKGIKEYWVSCNTNEHVFEKPVSGTIVESGTPSRAFIDALDAGDDRLIPAGGLTVSFENDSDVSYVINGNRNCVASKEISTEVRSTHQNKVLKIVSNTASTTFSCTFNTTYLASVFADSSVVAFAFDMKASNPAPKMSYANATGRYYEGNGDVGFGLTDTWKTFQITRAMYEANVDSNQRLICTVGGQSPAGTIFYFDNLRPVKELVTWHSFDVGRPAPSVNDADAWYGYVGSYRDEANKEVCTFNSRKGDLLNFRATDEYSSDGRRCVAMHKTKANYVGMYVLNLGLSDGDYVTVDVRTTVALNSNKNAKAIMTGNGSMMTSSDTYVHPANTWVTYTIPASEINSSGKILEFTGSPDHEIYIDNLVIHTAA